MEYKTGKTSKEKDVAYTFDVSSWIGIYATVTAILGFLLYAVVESPGYTGTLTVKKGDLTWFILIYLVISLMFEWKRVYDNNYSMGKILWVVLWLYVLVAGVTLILLAPR